MTQVARALQLFGGARAVADLKVDPTEQGASLGVLRIVPDSVLELNDTGPRIARVAVLSGLCNVTLGRLFGGFVAPR